MAIVPRLFHSPTGKCFLFSPKGSGDSLWAQSHFPKSIHSQLLQLKTSYPSLMDENKEKEDLDKNSPNHSLLEAAYKAFEARKQA